MMISMPYITRAMAIGSTFVIDYKSLRLAVLSGSKLICIGSQLEMGRAIEHAKHVIANQRVD